MQQNELQKLAAELLLAVKKGEETKALEAALAHWQGDLQDALSDDMQKKTFWINIYNAYFQILAVRGRLGKPDIYRKPLIDIAEHRFSLDDLEHGILRKYRYKFALGFLPNPFARKIIRQLAVQKIDYRIHFALNCGAVSCPPIAFYHAKRLDEQLELATLVFLETETEAHEAKSEIHVSRLMLWFLGDFGGFRGIRRILKEKLNLQTRGQHIVFKTYDWHEKLHAFAD